MYPAIRLPPAGKLTQKTSTAARVCTTTTGRLFITDEISKRRFLGDTGYDHCVHPSRLVPRRKERFYYDLSAANGTTTFAYRWLILNLNFGFRRNFTRRFVIADDTYPLIGVDFLSHFGLMVDCRNKRPLDGVTSLSAPAQAASSQVPSVKTITGALRSPASSLTSQNSLAQPEFNASCATTLFITSGRYQVHSSPADHGYWHRIASLSPKPNSTQCCGKAQLASQRVPGLPPSTSCPRRTTVGVYRALNARTIPDR
jgi:hypothetical protein